MLAFWLCAHYIKMICESCGENTETHTHTHLFALTSGVVRTAMDNFCVCLYVCVCTHKRQRWAERDNSCEEN